MRCEDDLPPLCVMFDRELPEAPFCLRIATQDGCEHVELEDAQGPAMSLPAAVCVCTRDGYEPTHYCEPGRGVHRIPDAIVRRPASPAQKPSA